MGRSASYLWIRLLLCCSASLLDAREPVVAPSVAQSTEVLSGLHLPCTTVIGGAVWTQQRFDTQASKQTTKPARTEARNNVVDALPLLLPLPLPPSTSLPPPPSLCAHDTCLAYVQHVDLMYVRHIELSMYVNTTPISTSPTNPTHPIAHPSLPIRNFAYPESKQGTIDRHYHHHHQQPTHVPCPLSNMGLFCALFRNLCAVCK